MQAILVVVKSTCVQLEGWSRDNSGLWHQVSPSFGWCSPLRSGICRTAHWCTQQQAPSYNMDTETASYDTLGNSVPYHLSLLIWSPKPGVSVTVSFNRTPCSSITVEKRKFFHSHSHILTRSLTMANRVDFCGAWNGVWSRGTSCPADLWLK